VRLKQLDLIKYGKFDGEALSFPRAEHDFHLIVGPNEAGKSTVRNAISELLFGMAHKTPLAFRHDVSELRLGGVLESAEGEVKLHRARGKNSLRTPADEKLPEDYLTPLLGGVSKEFFEQMFGLDHDRLIEGGRSILDASKDLGRVLFQSASGVASLGPVRDGLETRLRELWSNRAAGSEYAQAETRYKEAKKEFEVTQVRTKVWVDARLELERVDMAIIDIKDKRLQLETLRSRLERIRRLAPLMTDLKSREAEYAALGEGVEFPPSAYADLVKAQADIAAAEQLLQARMKDLEARRQDKDTIETDATVLALAEDIEALNDTRSACLNHSRELFLKQAEVERLLEECIAAARQIAWPDEEQALRNQLPSQLALDALHNLLQQHALLFQSYTNAADAVNQKQLELDELNARLNKLVLVKVPEALRQAYTNALTFKNSLTEQASFQVGLEEAQRTLHKSLLSLGPWEKPVVELKKMVMPSLARATTFQHQAREAAQAVKHARERLQDSGSEMQRLMFEEKHFIESNKVVTQAEVAQARTNRDSAWNDIKGGAVTLQAGASKLDSALRLADELVDGLLMTASDAAKLASIRQQLELAQAAQYRDEQALATRETELTAIFQQWDALMATAGLSGLALDDFAEWMTRRDAVFIAEDEMYKSQQRLTRERQAYEEAKFNLLEAFLASDGAAENAKDLALLVSDVAIYMQKADAASLQKAHLAEQQEQAERILKALLLKQEAAAQAYEGWKVNWHQALINSKLDKAVTDVTQAAAVLALANLIMKNFVAIADLQRNGIELLRAELDAFGAEAHRVCGLLNLEAISSDLNEVVRLLVARLRSAQKAEQAEQLAVHALREAVQRKEETTVSLAEAEARIQPLLDLAGVSRIHEALPLAERSDKRRTVRAAINHAMASLLKEGEGLSREQIEIEIAGQDPAALLAQLEQTKRALAELIEQESALVQQQVTARQAFDAINGAANAATAEAKRQEALAAMGDVAEQYVQLATARRLLKWAIDQYRDQKQGPMLQRAGEIFAQLTLGHFSRLVADYEMNPPALFAKRNTGKQVDVTGLSEGTRDQLFLALRIAALELHLNSAVAMPFIADDLFVNFDDERSKAGFAALRELSGHTQVIFLTHHTHLIPLIEEVMRGSLNVIELHRQVAN